MPAYSKASKSRLDTCHPDLQRVFNKVIGFFDHTIIEGHRGKEAQNAAFAAGNSKLKWPNGNHNSLPSKAVDAAPVEYKDRKAVIDWKDVQRMSFFAGQVLATARAMGITLRWGGDWDSDTELKDNSFDDLVHFEIVER